MNVASLRRLINGALWHQLLSLRPNRMIFFGLSDLERANDLTIERLKEL